MSQVNGEHPNDETVGRYCMKSMDETELERFRLHVFFCLICQYRVTERAFRACTTLPTEDEPFFMRNVFLSHGGPSFTHVRAVCELLNELGFVSVVAQELPSFGLSVQEKVQGWMRICRSAIVLATADNESDGTNSRTRQNIEHEIGMLQTSPTIQNRIVYLKESTVLFPSNHTEKVWIAFNRERIQDSFIPIIRELRALAL